MKIGNVAAILPAAGLGVRMGAHKKQFLKLEGTPILIHTLRKFSACPDISQILIAAPQEDLAEVQAALAGEDVGKNVAVVAGGHRRQDSVENCLRNVAPDTDLVAVHDAVRPFVSPELISAVLQEAARTGACILGMPPVDTVKQVERTRVTGTIPRERIVLAQTPQAFRYDILKQAFERAREEGFRATDEASLVEHMGLEVTVIRGTERNIKITHPGDLELARFFLQQERHALGASPGPPAGHKPQAHSTGL